MNFSIISSSLCLAICIAFIASVTSTSAATTSTESTKDNVDRNSIVPSPSTHAADSELSLPSNLVSILTNGGVVAAGLLAVSAVAMLVMPFFGLRFCSLFGTCDPYQNSYASGYANDAAYASGYGQAMYTPSSYQKRSIEYIGPILKALSSAYDKYGKMNAASSTNKST